MMSRYYSSSVLLITLLCSLANVNAGVKQKITTQQQLNAAKQKGNVILKYTADWCPACQMVKEDFETLSNSYPDIYFASVDVTANPDLANNNNVSGLPTFVFIKNGVEVDREEGGPENFQAAMSQKIKNRFGSADQKKKEPDNIEQIDNNYTINQEEPEISAPVQPSAQEPVAANGILGHIGLLFANIFKTIKDIFLGIIDWFRKLLGL
ncbi:hypothetical protein Noda2021_00570 [Candidatus Dependentiae bacterium Noda2021]|nr:hypothetical protein Noda2021_00570 [Candidatus Dependentiae bacterium Noda2021]